MCIRDRGKGETGVDALYDLFSDLYILPITRSIPRRVSTFLKMVLLDGVAVSDAAKLLRRDRRSRQEQQIMRLSRQALLSTAELVKCGETRVEDLSWPGWRRSLP